MFLDNERYLKDILNVEEVILNNKTVRKHRALIPNSEKTTKNPIYKADIDLIYQNIDKIYTKKNESFINAFGTYRCKNW